MTAYAATSVTSTAGTVVAPRTGTTSADTVPAGSLVLWRNTGAGTHVVTLTNSATYGGLTVSNRTISIAAGAVTVGRVDPAWADANSAVAVGIDGTASEVVYYVLGGV